MLLKNKPTVATSSKVWAVVAYLFGLVGVVLVCMFRKKGTFERYHAYESFSLFLAASLLFLAALFSMFVGSFFLETTGVAGVISTIVVIFGALLLLVARYGAIILVIIGILNAITGKREQLPIISKLFKNK